MIEVRAHLKHLRISPKKVRLVTNSLRGLSVDDALVRLQFTNKISSSVIVKLLKSAIANAGHNSDIPSESLMIKSIIVNEAPAMKRWKPAAFGAAHPFKKRGSHVNLVLTLKAGVTLTGSKSKDTNKQQKDGKDSKEAIKTVKAEDIKQTSKPSIGKQTTDMRSSGKQTGHEHKAARGIRKSPASK